MAHQVIILEPGIGRFREFEPRRVHTRIHSLGLFLCAQNGLRKAQERELATLDEKTTGSGIAESDLCAIKIEGKNRGEEGTTFTCDHGLSKRSWSSKKSARTKKRQETLARVLVSLTIITDCSYNVYPPLYIGIYS